MKKLGLTSLSVLVTMQGAFALNCLEQVENASKIKLAKSIGTIPSYLTADFVTGETLDGDTTSDGLDLTPSWEVLELRYADPNNQFDEYATHSKPLATYAVLLNTYKDMKTGSIVECEIVSIDAYNN